MLFCFPREIRRLRKQRKRLKERLVMKGTSEESGELIRQEHLFRMTDIKSKGHLEEVEKGEEKGSGESDNECVGEEMSGESNNECAVEEEKDISDATKERMDKGEGDEEKDGGEGLTVLFEHLGMFKVLTHRTIVMAGKKLGYS